MKQYLQYYTLDLEGNLYEALGSDGYMPLDGRLSLYSCIEKAKTLKNFRNYDKWAIMQGNFKRSTILYKNFN